MEHSRLGYKENSGISITKDGVCKRSIQGKYAIVACICVLIGSVLANICFRDKIIVDYGLYSILDRLQSVSSISRNKLFVYLAERRSVQFLLFLLVMKMIPKSFQSVIVISLSGILWGIYISVQSMCNGVSGLLVGTVVLFPHGFFYIGGIMLWLSKNQYKHSVMAVIIVLLCIFAGIGLESFVQPNLLQFFALQFK